MYQFHYVPDYRTPGSDGLGDYHTYAAHLRRKREKAEREALLQSTKQSTKQSTNQSTNQPTTQPIQASDTQRKSHGQLYG